jgi:hypothetical protein
MYPVATAQVLRLRKEVKLLRRLMVCSELTAPASHPSTVGLSKRCALRRDLRADAEDDAGKPPHDEMKHKSRPLGIETKSERASYRQKSPGFTAGASRSGSSRTGVSTLADTLAAVENGFRNATISITVSRAAKPMTTLAFPVVTLIATVHLNYPFITIRLTRDRAGVILFSCPTNMLAALSFDQ